MKKSNKKSNVFQVTFFDAAAKTHDILSSVAITLAHADMTEADDKLLKVVTRAAAQVRRMQDKAERAERIAAKVAERTERKAAVAAKKEERKATTAIQLQARMAKLVEQAAKLGITM
jgi:hypothetical protein